MRIKQRAMKDWLKSDIRFKYGVLNQTNLKCYHLHQKLTSNLHKYEAALDRHTRHVSDLCTNVYDKWLYFERRVHKIAQSQFGDKIRQLKDKSPGCAVERHTE